ncbi:MAG: hypothetical protein H6Q18_54 [Bacteroidetes bacterium]|nr:hypothetical protein [Bacteroidota bacterium]
MSQKEIFERIYNIVLLRGIDRTLEAIDAMYESYCKLDKGDSEQLTEDIVAIKNELKEIFFDSQYYKDSMHNRGLTEVDRNFFMKNKISKELLVKDLSIVEKEDTIFYDKRVVLTGVFSRYPVRNFLADKLKKLGADLNTSVSKKTEIVCLGGVGVGPSKMAKIVELQNSGVEIMLIEELDLYKILDKL